MDSSSTADDEGRPHSQSGVPEWREFFPYDTPYPEQEDAIGPIQDAIDDGGFVELEGACGTGKTLIAILSGITKVRDPSSKIERVLVLTNVKQQIRIFEEDTRSINESLPEGMDPISTLTMVSKPDLCPYVDAGVIDHQELYGRCEDLRETVRNQAENAPTHPASIFEDMAAEVEVSSRSSVDPLMTADWATPYEPEIPEDPETEAEYCPFYARFRADQFHDDYAAYAPADVTPQEDILRTQSERGVCPHARMAEAVDQAEVVIGNYQHVFDETTTRLLTHEVLSEDTVVVADEAHNLVSRARNELSDSMAYQTLEDSIAEIQNYILESSGPIEEEVWGYLSQTEVTESDITTLLTFLEELRDQFKAFVVDALDAENQSWPTNPDSLPDTISQTLGHPEENKQDQLSVWAELGDLSQVWANLDEYLSPVVAVLDELSRNDHINLNRVSSQTVQRVLTNWRERDYIQYFRQLEITRRDRNYESREGFSQYFNASLELKNTIPREEIADRLDQFGGGLLMSATLEPFPVFESEIGLDILESEHDRPIESLSYGLSYPPENRLSLHLPLTKFTYGNRGPPEGSRLTEEQASVRDSYEMAINTVVQQTPGNVMIAMPSYAEAAWAADILKSSPSIEKQVVVDESSSNSATQALKQEFFTGGPKVLVTGLLGTLTEGIDYAGDKLTAVLIVGVPIKSTQDDYSTAQEYAYTEEFGREKGFEYAFQIPAVRKARQAYGRAIRAPEERGVRVLADERYGYEDRWDGVAMNIPEYERAEFFESELSELETKLSGFWS